ncbi:AAA family ATPase [Candidatus Woesearchaeota archaeon]|nr:AAA family ATPase [Candidatus Woesearchaeota archaeon]
MDLSSFGVEVKKKHQEVQDENLNIDTEELRKTFAEEKTEHYLPWFLKYAISSFGDLDMTPELKKVVDFIENFKPGKALLLVGMPGCGKTTTVTTLAAHYDRELFELNASDARGKSVLNEQLGQGIKQHSLFAKKKLILVDEVDGISGKYDRGGMAELVSLIKTSKVPIIATANDKESEKIKALKKVATVLDFEQHSQSVLVNLGKKIFEGENITYKEEDLDAFIRVRSSSDIRGFINDLQASTVHSCFVPDENLEIRDYKRKIQQLLDSIYFSYPEDAYKKNFATDISLDELFLYLEENSAVAYRKEAFVAAYNDIAKADVFRGRILRWQYYRYLVYVNFYLTYALSSEKSEKNPPQRFALKKNNRILKKWIYANKVGALRARTRVEKEKGAESTALEKLAKKMGRSANRTRKEDIFYLSFIAKHDKAFVQSLSKTLVSGEKEQEALRISLDSL